MKVLLYGYSEESKELLVVISSAIREAGHEVEHPSLSSTIYLSVRVMRSFDMAILVGFSPIDSIDVGYEIIISEVATLAGVPFGIVECGKESFISVACIENASYKIEGNISWVFWFNESSCSQIYSEGVQTSEASKTTCWIVEKVVSSSHCK